ncbi:hypothetical protein MJO28_004486 [Puccinia striiformis f. sp. tritici]|uniref:Uncharacterized protein n=1 Tax=Puccinia striiformis f. sp. tritici TaxID=168172 RepID=A0ACC0EPY3_9BASI|nr:hypothetical protein MJO28_004486 [Puccinia striiformis f. sp. tritici]
MPPAFYPNCNRSCTGLLIPKIDEVIDWTPPSGFKYKTVPANSENCKAFLQPRATMPSQLQSRFMSLVGTTTPLLALGFYISLLKNGSEIFCLVSFHSTYPS